MEAHVRTPEQNKERRTVWVPPELWEQARQDARVESVETGEDVGIGEWVRRAIVERLERRSRK